VSAGLEELQSNIIVNMSLAGKMFFSLPNFFPPPMKKGNEEPEILYPVPFTEPTSQDAKPRVQPGVYPPFI
jgi:hypothetical protein